MIFCNIWLNSWHVHLCLEIFLTKIGRSVQILLAMFQNESLWETLKNVLKLQAKVPNVFTSKWWLSARFSTCFRFGWLKSLPPSVNNLFRGSPFSQEDKIYEHIQESLLVGRRTKGNFACCFRSFLQVFERGFLQKISYFDGKEWPIKAE